MGHNSRAFEQFGYERPRVATQAVGGQRGVSIWGVGILAKDLRAALRDEWLFSGCARELRAGDRIHLASYIDSASFQTEQRSETAELVVTRVLPPDPIRRAPGKVDWKLIHHFDFREKDAVKMIEDMREFSVMEAPAG